MHLKLTNGVPAKYTLGQLRRDNPQTSFPKLIPDSILAAYDVYPYTRPEVPDCDPLTSKLVDGTFEQDAVGNWSLVYLVEQQPLDQAERNIRSRRDGLLLDTDWMALSDNTMTPAWASYRQALRDITAQAGFPYEVIWPTKQE
jgi:hypothetical protein